MAGVLLTKKVVSMKKQYQEASKSCCSIISKKTLFAILQYAYVPTLIYMS